MKQREIKFRFWDRDGKEIVNELKGFAYKGINQLFDDFLNTKQFIPMQYTGLKDKNGKEIYFEDYVKDENFSAYTFIVKWNKTKISLLNISNGDIIDIDNINNLTINSNVYENSFKFTPKHKEIS